MSIAAYPPRPQLYALRYIDWLLQSGLIAETGADGFAILVMVAMQEDRQRYKRHVNFWTKQLCDGCGVSKQTLISARKRLVKLGLLEYEPGARQRPGKYFTTGMGLDTVQNLDLNQSQSNPNLIPSLPTPNPKPTKSVRKPFVRPTLEEVEAYCRERKSTVDAKRFWDYFEVGEWRDSNGKLVKNWKQKLLTWESKSTATASGKTDPSHLPFPRKANV